MSDNLPHADSYRRCTMTPFSISDAHNDKSKFDKLCSVALKIAPDAHFMLLGDMIDRGKDESGIDIILTAMDSPNRYTYLLGNHERMMMDALSIDGSIIRDERAFLKWLLNGGSPTFEFFKVLSKVQKRNIMEFLHTRNDHMHLTLEDERKYLLSHAWPYHDNHLWGVPPQMGLSVWEGDEHLVMGHVVTLRLFKDQQAHLDALQASGDHLRIFHGNNFTVTDCGCGHDYLTVARLGMLCIETGEEFYV